MRSADDTYLTSLAVNAAFCLYDASWQVTLPALRRSARLSNGFSQRTLQQPRLESADVWIQAASAGEAYLAWELLKRFRPARPCKVLLSANTRQGIDILRRAAADPNLAPTVVKVASTYFPFDRPAIMRKAVAGIRPRVMVLLESELWPGCLRALKSSGSRIVVVNGRLSPSSLRMYMIWPRLWRLLAPDRILAVSSADAKRFKRLFGAKRVGTMSNIKFDRVSLKDTTTGATIRRLEKLVPAARPFMVFGSVRKEEAQQVAAMVKAITRRRPDILVGLFPRHMHHLSSWAKLLMQHGLAWQERSQLTSAAQVCTPVLLWDVFGELGSVYGLAQAAFVGGSLAPLGGQNFLEALSWGVLPVSGPHWHNFAWVGAEIVRRGLLRTAATWQEAVEHLLAATRPRSEVKRAFAGYIRDRQGGVLQACSEIERQRQALPRHIPAP